MPSTMDRLSNMGQLKGYNNRFVMGHLLKAMTNRAPMEK